MHQSEAKVFARQLPSHNPSRALNSERRHANTRRSNGHWEGRSSPSDEGKRHSAQPPCHSRMGELRSAQCLSHSNGRRGDSHGSEADCPGCERYRDSSPAHACPEKMASKQNYFHAGRHGSDAPKDALQRNHPPVAKETFVGRNHNDEHATSQAVGGFENEGAHWRCAREKLLVGLIVHFNSVAVADCNSGQKK